MARKGVVCPETARQKRAKTLSPSQPFFSAGVEAAQPDRGGRLGKS